MTQKASRKTRTQSCKAGSLEGSLPPYVNLSSKGVLLRLHVQPKASKTEFSGMHGSSLKLRVKAPPVEGAANKACRRYLAKCLNVPPSAVVLKSGACSREKTFLIEGAAVEKIIELLPQ